MRRLLKGRTTFRSDHPGEFLLNVSRSTEIRVGLVSLVSIAVLIGGMAYLGWWLAREEVGAAGAKA